MGFFSFGVVHLSGLKLHLINLLLILYLPRANIPLLITVLVRKGGPLHFRLMLQENPATEKKREINYEALANVHIVILPVIKVQLCLPGSTALRIEVINAYLM